MISLFLKVKAIYELKMQINNLKLFGILILVSRMLVSSSKGKQEDEAGETQSTNADDIRRSIPPLKSLKWTMAETPTREARMLRLR